MIFILWYLFLVLLSYILRGFSVYTCDVSIVSRSERGRKINAVVDQAGKAMTDTTKAVGTCVAM